MVSDSSSSRLSTLRELVMTPKYLALIILTLQTVVVVNLMRSSQQESMYMTSTAVVCAEVGKIIGGLLMARRDQDFGSILRDIFEDKRDLLLVAIPGLLYTIQNNLTFIALNNLSSAVYQLTFQLKVLTTGLLSVLMLGKVLSRNKWLALVVLALGVCLIQVQQHGNKSGPETGSAFIGLAAVIAACCTSALAGVSLEKLIKGTPKSVWTRSIQVAVWGLLLSIVAAFVQDGEKIQERGFFSDYSGIVWLVILVQAGGGMVVAAVMKYADNILKCFASASAIVLIILVEGGHGLSFLPGTVMIITASTMYGLDSTPLTMLQSFVLHFSTHKNGYVGVTVSTGGASHRNSMVSFDSNLSHELSTVIGK